MTIQFKEMTETSSIGESDLLALQQSTNPYRRITWVNFKTLLNTFFSSVFCRIDSIVDSLTSTSTVLPLSANQGSALNTLISQKIN